MIRTTRRGLLIVLCLVAVAGLVLTGCGKKEKALQQPGLEFTTYVKGPTVDFDDATLNTMADSGGEAGFKYGIMKSIYPTIFASNKDTVAQTLFGVPYWRGDGVHTYYSYLTSADQTAVDATIFATKLSAAEQAIVTGTVDSFFALYADEIAAAKALNQNTAYGVLAYKVSAAAATAWETDATAWMAALNAYAATNYSGKTYAQLTYVERATVNGIVFANGAGTINPEYSFWRAMVETSFRNGNASARYPDVRDAKVTELYPGSTYTGLDCVQKPTVDGAVWAALTSGQTDNVSAQIAGLYNLATEQVNGVTSDNQNIYYYTLLSLPDYLTTDNSAATAAAGWLTAVNGTAAGTTENTTFYGKILGGQTTWRTMLANSYFGLSYDNLTDASKAVVVEADAGMTSLSVAQRSAAMPLTSNVIYLTLKYRVGSTTAADGWAADVGAGIDRKLALYKWMAYESFRNGTAATFYPTQVAERLAALYPGKTAATLTSCETMALNSAVWAALGTGEQAYGTTAVSGIWGKAQAEMTDAEAIDQTTLSMALRGALMYETPATNFKAAVESGMLLRQAFYRWLAKERVKETASAASLIQQSVGEFYFKITNPNKYEISIDQLTLYFKTAVGSSSETIDGARQVLEGIWIPAEGEITLKVMAPTKTYDLISWLAIAGKDTNTARSLAAQVWSKIQDGTIVWTCQADVQVSHGNDIENYSLSGAVGTVLAIV
jgi:hypothetical protein